MPTPNLNVIELVQTYKLLSDSYSLYMYVYI